MLIPDVNILLHAYNRNSREHAPALEWWERTLSSGQPVGLSTVTVLGFLRIMTNRGVLANPMPIARATGIVRSWLHADSVRMIHPTEGHAERLLAYLELLGIGGNITTDAWLAALAVEYQAELVSTDTDFARFPGLRWFNPLQQHSRRR